MADLHHGRLWPNTCVPHDAISLTGRKGPYMRTPGRRRALAPQEEGAGRRRTLAPQEEDAGRRRMLAPQEEDAGRRRMLAPQEEDAGRRRTLAPPFIARLDPDQHPLSTSSDTHQG